jgi:dienelactone hydrolase
MAIFEEDEKEIIRNAGFEAMTAPSNGWLADDDKCLDPKKDEELQKKLGSRCVYFDAIEIADHCFDLPKEGE